MIHELWMVHADDKLLQWKEGDCLYAAVTDLMFHIRCFGFQPPNHFFCFSNVSSKPSKTCLLSCRLLCRCEQSLPWFTDMLHVGSLLSLLMHNPQYLLFCPTMAQKGFFYFLMWLQWQCASVRLHKHASFFTVCCCLPFLFLSIMAAVVIDGILCFFVEELSLDVIHCAV